MNNSVRSVNYTWRRAVLFLWAESHQGALVAFLLAAGGLIPMSHQGARVALILDGSGNAWAEAPFWVAGSCIVLSKVVKMVTHTKPHHRDRSRSPCTTTAATTTTTRRLSRAPPGWNPSPASFVSNTISYLSVYVQNLAPVETWASLHPPVVTWGAKEHPWLGRVWRGFF